MYTLCNSQYPPVPPSQGYGTPLPPGGYELSPGSGPPGSYRPPPGYKPPPPGYPQHGRDPPGSHPPPPILDQPMGQGATRSSPGAPGGSMKMPQGPANCPPGLEYLAKIDQVLVHQKVELLEVFTGWETKNKYTIKNSSGQKIYYAVEDSGCCTRNCCFGYLRPFDMIILDNYKNEVIHLYRPLACDSCWCPCCLQSMEVFSPPGTIVGFVEQKWSICCPSYAVKSPNGETVFRIEGPFCTTSICGADVDFQVLSADGQTRVGKISKQWSGLMREAFTDADFFGITFPMNLDVRMKAVMLGACFLIDMMFFESRQSGQSSGQSGS